MSDSVLDDDQLEWAEERFTEDVEGLGDYGTDTSGDSDSSDGEQFEPVPTIHEHHESTTDNGVRTVPESVRDRLRETTKTQVREWKMMKLCFRFSV